MTTNELRAKFEAWATTEGSAYYGGCSFNLDQDGEYADMELYGAYLAFQAAHASRDAEVEALKRDAERYRWLRDIGDATWTPLRERMPSYNVDSAIDAAMQEGAK